MRERQAFAAHARGCCAPVRHGHHIAAAVIDFVGGRQARQRQALGCDGGGHIAAAGDLVVRRLAAFVAGDAAHAHPGRRDLVGHEHVFAVVGRPRVQQAGRCVATDQTGDGPSWRKACRRIGVAVVVACDAGVAQSSGQRGRRDGRHDGRNARLRQRIVRHQAACGRAADRKRPGATGVDGVGMGYVCIVVSQRVSAAHKCQVVAGNRTRDGAGHAGPTGAGGAVVGAGEGAANGGSGRDGFGADRGDQTRGLGHRIVGAVAAAQRVAGRDIDRRRCVWAVEAARIDRRDVIDAHNAAQDAARQAGVGGAVVVFAGYSSARHGQCLGRHGQRARGIAAVDRVAQQTAAAYCRDGVAAHHHIAARRACAIRRKSHARKRLRSRVPVGPTADAHGINRCVGVLGQDV